MINLKSIYNMKGLCFAACCALAFASCSDADAPTSNLTELTPPSTVELVIPADIQKLLYTDATGSTVLPMIAGKTVSLGYTITPAAAADWQMEWTSSDPEVATVDNGTINAISNKNDGYSIVTAIPAGIQSGQGPSQTLKVNVDDIMHPATSINMTLAASEVYVSETVKASVDIEPEGTTYRTVDWSVSNPALASVDMDGTVHALGVEQVGQPSTINVIATALDGSGCIDSKPLTIIPIVEPTNVTLDTKYDKSKYDCSINEQTIAIDFTTEPSYATKSLLTWTSSNTDIATVANGVVTFNQNGNFGEVTITATCPNGTKKDITLNLPAGKVRDLFTKDGVKTWKAAASNGATISYENGYIQCKSNTSGSNQRGDLSSTGKVWLHAGNYPILAVKIDYVRDTYPTTTKLNFNIDGSSGTSPSGGKFSGNLKGNNGWTKFYKLSDGSRLLIYDLSALAWAGGDKKALPTTETVTFGGLNIKYPDIQPATQQYDYKFYWFQTFKTEAEALEFVKSQGITY